MWGRRTGNAYHSFLWGKYGVRLGIRIQMPTKGDVRIDALTDREEVWTGTRWMALDEPSSRYDGMTYREWLAFHRLLKNAKPPLPEQSPDDPHTHIVLQAKYQRVMG